MTALSPAAQAVMDAYCSRWRCVKAHSGPLAAALRAAADQVVPEPPMIVEGGRSYEEAWTVPVRDDVRRRFLAIAAELEGHQ